MYPPPYGYAYPPVRMRPANVLEARTIINAHARAQAQAQAQARVLENVRYGYRTAQPQAIPTRYSSSEGAYMPLVGQAPRQPTRPIANVPPQPPVTPGVEQSDARFLDRVRAGLRGITPELIIGGIITGAAFAVGAGLVSRYVFGEGRGGGS